jgi:hypothetical protein
MGYSRQDWLRLQVDIFQIAQSGADKRSVRQYPVEHKARLLAEASNLTGEQLTSYLEQKGVKLADLIAGDSLLKDDRRESAATTQRIRRLQHELARREKALAEAAALLVLKEQ